MPMQPRPSSETSSADVVPRVRRVVMPSTEQAGARSKSSGRLGAHPRLVETDLVVDGAEVVLHLGEPGQHHLPMRAEQVQPLLLVALAGPDQVGVAAYVADGHASAAQLGDEPDPVD